MSPAENTAPAGGSPPPPAGPNAAAAPLPAVPEALPTVGGGVDVDIDRPAAESTANGTRTSAPASGAGDAKDHHAAGDGGEDCPPPADGAADADAQGDDTGEEPDDDEEQEEQGASESSDGEEKEEVWDLRMILNEQQIDETPCDGDGCDLRACLVYASNLAPEEPWQSCLDCQRTDYGGWPEELKDVPARVLPTGLREKMLDRCAARDTPFDHAAEWPDLPTGDEDPADAPPAAPADDVDEAADEDAPAGEEEEEESPVPGPVEEEGWDLRHVYSADEIRARAAACMGKDGECDNVACSRYVSTLDEDDVWDTCVDCQEGDYDGWPEDEGEYPVDHVTEEHREVMAEMCSKAQKPNMPVVPCVPPPPEAAAASLHVTAGGDAAAAAPAAAGLGMNITPLPGQDAPLDGTMNDIAVAPFAHKKKKKSSKQQKGTVTPLPPSGAAGKKPAACKPPAAEGGESKPAAKPAPAKKEAPKPVSKKNLEMYKKWQAEADKMGGGKITVDRSDAKKAIFDVLHDSFKPMNVNGLYQSLKGVVPRALLNGCLEDMVGKDTGNPFADDDSSDDDDDKPKKKKAASKKNKAKSEDGAAIAPGSFTGSLRLKNGRNVNNNLYYVDHTKLANNGNGLPPHERNDLIAEKERSRAEHGALLHQCKQTAMETARLEGEPRNEELEVELSSFESALAETSEGLEVARGYAGNEKHAKGLQKAIDSMGGTWRKRKRSCMEFLMNMEDATDGKVDVKKCLKGDGVIDIDSDEMAIDGAVQFAQRKRPRVLSSKGTGQAGLKPNANFVGVRLGAAGKPERVFMGDVQVA